MALSDASTVISESILVHGHLHGDEDLTVRGRVEGTVTLTKALLVEPTGSVRAEVQVKSCVISGLVVGNVTASDSVEITKDGRMVGDISAPRVVIVEGASFRGGINMAEADAAAAERAEQAARPVTRTPRPLPRAAKDEEARPALVEKAAAAAAAVKPPAPPVPVAMGVKRKVIVRRK